MEYAHIEGKTIKEVMTKLNEKSKKGWIYRDQLSGFVGIVLLIEREFPKADVGPK